MAGIKHKKHNNVPNFTQADLDQQIAAGQYAPGTTLNDITLAQDWNDDHTAPAGTTAGYVLTVTDSATGAVGFVPPSGGSTMPAAPNRSVQFNNNGAFGGDANLTYDGDTLFVNGGTNGTGNGALYVTGSQIGGVAKIINNINSSYASTGTFLAPNVNGDVFFSVGRTLTNGGAALTGYNSTGAFLTTFGRPASDFQVTTSGLIRVGSLAGGGNRVTAADGAGTIFPMPFYYQPNIYQMTGSDSSGNGVQHIVENTSTGNSFAIYAMRTAGTNDGLFFGGKVEYPSYGIVNGITFRAGSSTQDIGFSVGATTTGGGNGPSLMIKSSGNVGVGNSNPNAKLTVSGQTHLDGGVVIGSDSLTSNPGQLKFYENGYPYMLFLNQYTGTTTADGFQIGVEGPSMEANLLQKENAALNFWVAGAKRFYISPDGSTTVTNLSGTGTRMVTADANGTLSTQAIPSGSGYAPNGRTGTNGASYVGPQSGEPANLNTPATGVMLGATTGSAINGIIKAGTSIQGVQMPGISTFTNVASFGDPSTAFTQYDYGNRLVKTYVNGLKVAQAAGDGSFYGGDVDAATNDGLAVRVSQGGQFARLGNESSQHLNIDVGQEVTQMRVGGQIVGSWNTDNAFMGTDGGTNVYADWSNNLVNIRVAGPQVAQFYENNLYIGDVDGNYSNIKLGINQADESVFIGSENNTEWRVQGAEIFGRVYGNRVFYGNDSYDGAIGDMDRGSNGWIVSAENSNDRVLLGNEDYGSTLEMSGNLLVRMRQGNNSFLQSNAGDVILGDVDNTQNQQAIKILQSANLIVIGNPNSNTSMVVDSANSKVNFNGLSGVTQYGYDEFQVVNGDTSQLGLQLNWNSQLFRFGDINQTSNGTRYEIDNAYKRHGFGTSDGIVRLANLNGEEFINYNTDGIKFGRLNAGNGAYYQIYDTLKWVVTNCTDYRFAQANASFSTYTGNNYFDFLRTDASNTSLGDKNNGFANVNIVKSTNQIQLNGGLKVNCRTVTAAGNIAVATTDNVIVVRKTTGAATTVTLPTAPLQGTQFTIKDGKGDAATNNITLTAGGTTQLDGATTATINSNYGSITVIYDGTRYSMI